MNPTTARKHILVVDDEPGMLFMMSERLTNWGYEVLTAQSGEEGWRLIKEHLPDLALLDIMMPTLKGRDLCELLKAHPRTKDIPVIFVTALALPDHIKAGLDVGADDYIVKPFQPADLKDRIRVCLSRHRLQPRTSMREGWQDRSGRKRQGGLNRKGVPDGTHTREEDFSR